MTKAGAHAVRILRTRYRLEGMAAQSKLMMLSWLIQKYNWINLVFLLEIPALDDGAETQSCST